MFKLEDLSPKTRMSINAAQLPMKTVGYEMADLRPYKGEVQAQVSQWMDLVRSGRVIKARGEATCGLGLLLVGEPGHGKTTLASTVVQELIRTMPREVLGSPDHALTRPVFFTDYPKFLRMQKRQWEEENEEDATLIASLYGEAGPGDNVRILVLDDLGKEYRTASGWSENTFDALLRARYNAGLPTIVTTNVPLQQWGTVYGEPMGSFAHEAFLPLAVVSKEGDRRL